ncbi:hypothetical protein SA15R_07445, partial [Rothia kristinae]
RTAQRDTVTIMWCARRPSPIHGVQVHPESVLTEDGYLMVGNWLEMTGLHGAAGHARGMSPLLAS